MHNKFQKRLLVVGGSGLIGSHISKKCEEFVKRNEKMLFEINTKITSINSSLDECWILIDSDNTCHKDADGNDETSAHPPFGEGILDFDTIVPILAKENVGHDWWTVDLCFWPEAWAATEKCKGALDQLVSKYG